MFMKLFNIKLEVVKIDKFYLKLINKLYMGFDMFETVHKLSLYTSLQIILISNLPF